MRNGPGAFPRLDQRVENDDRREKNNVAVKCCHTYFLNVATLGELKLSQRKTVRVVLIL